MKKTQKKLGNKGFSLVELIVVIAIMAVLVGVLAPTLIKNIEKSRVSNDTVKGAITTVLADETYYSDLKNNEVYIAADGTVSVKNEFTPADSTLKKLSEELIDTISKEKVEMTSKDLKGKKITFKIEEGKVSDYTVSAS